MTSNPASDETCARATVARPAAWKIVVMLCFVTCVTVMCYRAFSMAGLTEVRTYRYPGVATGVAAQESGALVAAISNQNLSVIDRDSGTMLYRYTPIETETCGQGLCWSPDENALLFSTGGKVLCLNIEKIALSRGVAVTHHHRITQLMFHNDLLLIAGDLFGDFGNSHVEVWRWNGTANSLTKESELKAFEGNAHAMSLRCDSRCCIAVIASGENAGVALVPFHKPGDWGFSKVRRIPIDATLVAQLDNERFVFRGPRYVEVYRIVNCGDTVTREWCLAIDADREARYPIYHAGFRSLDVVDGGLIVLGTAEELAVLDRNGILVGKRKKLTGAVCGLGQRGAFIASHPGTITEYQVP